MASHWNHAAQDSIAAYFDDLVTRLREQQPLLRSNIEYQSTASRPYTAILSLMTPNKVDLSEDVVVEMAVYRLDAAYKFAIDISLGSGEILSDGPSSLLPITEQDDAIRDWFGRCVDDALAFLALQEKLVANALVD